MARIVWVNEIIETESGEINFLDNFDNNASEELLCDANLITIRFSKKFLDENKKEKINEMFTKFNWEKMKKLKKIELDDSSGFLCEFIPRRADSIELLQCDLHSISIISKNIKHIDITFMMSSFVKKSLYDASFFERLPLSLKSIEFHILLDDIDAGGEIFRQIFDEGFHNLPLCLQYFTFCVFLPNKSRYVFSEKQIDDIKKSFTFGPGFISLKINDTVIDYI